MESLKKLQKGCGKKFKTIWNFGNQIEVKCGWKEEGFMPNYCEECNNKIKMIKSKKQTNK